MAGGRLQRDRGSYGKMCERELKRLGPQQHSRPTVHLNKRLTQEKTRRILRGRQNGNNKFGGAQWSAKKGKICEKRGEKAGLIKKEKNQRNGNGNNPKKDTQPIKEGGTLVLRVGGGRWFCLGE